MYASGGSLISHTIELPDKIYRALERYAAARDQPDARDYTPHIRPIGEDTVYARSLDPTKRPRRWVVERTHSWLNRSRWLFLRWEKLRVTYHAFLHLACALICFQQCDHSRTLGAVSEKVLRAAATKAACAASHVNACQPS